MRLVLPFPPSANRYWRTYRGRVVMSAHARAYKAAVGMQCAALGLVPLKGPVALQMDFHRPARRGDLDNMEKVAIDALQGFAYVNDAQIVEIHARRFDDKRNPRVEINVEAADETGL